MGARDDEYDYLFKGKLANWNSSYHCEFISINLCVDSENSHRIIAMTVLCYQSACSHKWEVTSLCSNRDAVK